MSGVAHTDKPTPPPGHPSEEGMGVMGWNGSNHLDSTYPYQLPHPLLGGVARRSFSEGGTGWVCLARFEKWQNIKGYFLLQSLIALSMLSFCIGCYALALHTLQREWSTLQTLSNGINDANNQLEQNLSNPNAPSKTVIIDSKHSLSYIGINP
jgi:hypothetical protein